MTTNTKWAVGTKREAKAKPMSNSQTEPPKRLPILPPPGTEARRDYVRRAWEEAQKEGR
jgi:hypothetical protein